ncbi:CAP domain-containing protein [Haliangium ochraceum]|uniref:SCP-like extracellular n=1 Tax=Haliangium ochraceum (strain DSM 14365 / JCM 11303 / SMP-2) TaxID=502025 RepID=D0LJB4_HALO1|nr:CAP domain-containing protein [Haliangium ochraceum]ACY14961.1 SCP-like extracellular [Haliangium ochraceum DSM 14365]
MSPLSKSSFATLCALSLLLGCTDEPFDEPPGGGVDASPDSGGGGGGGGTPSVDYCAAVADWPAAWREVEAALLEAVNRQRGEGADCGSEGSFGPAEPLSSDAALDCAARTHSLDMVTRDFFDHTNPDGERFSDRMSRAGYEFRAGGENIAYGSSTVDGVMEQWMGSDGHCANIMRPGYVHLGIGYHADSRLWTQVFGTPR